MSVSLLFAVCVMGYFLFCGWFSFTGEAGEDRMSWREFALETLWSKLKTGTVNEVSQALKQVGSSAVSAIDTGNGGQTALHIAVEAGRFELIDLLIGSGAVVDACDQLMQTPLHRAVRSNQPDCVWRLAAAGADCNRFDEYGHTALASAVTAGHTLCVKHLIRYGASLCALDAVPATNRIEPLMLAVTSARYDVITVLVRSGADLQRCKPFDTLNQSQRSTHRDRVMKAIDSGSAVLKAFRARLTSTLSLPLPSELTALITHYLAPDPFEPDSPPSAAAAVLHASKPTAVVSGGASGAEWGGGNTSSGRDGSDDRVIATVSGAEWGD